MSNVSGEANLAAALWALAATCPGRVSVIKLAGGCDYASRQRRAAAVAQALRAAGVESTDRVAVFLDGVEKNSRDQDDFRSLATVAAFVANRRQTVG